MATFVETGHIAIATSLFKETFYLALGTLPKDYQKKWTVEQEPPPFNPKNDSLILPIGYKVETLKKFVKEDENGTIEALGKRWSIVDYPTRNIYLEFKLDKEDASLQTIYQTGIYIRTKLKEGLPQGQQYFLPDQIEEEGILLVAENTRPYFKNPGEIKTYFTVLQF